MEISRTTAHRSTYRNTCSLIQTLPPELLLTIFKYAYVAARGKATLSDSSCPKDACVADQRCFCYLEPSEECDEYCDDDEIPLIALFPNSVASVCSRWGGLMLLVPAFWTRIIVSLDSDTFSPENLQCQLRASGERPFEIIVSRTSFSDAVGLKDVEQSRMVQIITALRSHLRWCQSLRIEVIHSSSLPRLLGILPSDIPHLRKLSLDSRIDSGRPEVQPYCLFRATPLHWYNIDSIVIDGWNLFDICGRPGCYYTPEEDTLSEGCYSLSVKFGEIRETGILALIEGYFVQFITIDSVTITPGLNPVINIPRWGIPVSFPNLITITLKNLGPETMEMILRYVHIPSQLIIDNCRFPSSSSTLVSRAETLELRNISPEQRLEDFIRAWCGTTLLVIDCPGFNDTVLNIMGSMVGDPNPQQPNRMKGLYTQDCHGFSVDALKAFLEKGIAGHRGRSKRWEALGVRRLGSLLSEEDMKWFETRVSQFCWRG